VTEHDNPLWSKGMNGKTVTFESGGNLKGSALGQLKHSNGKL
jgi:hypothetical protein